MKLTFLNVSESPALKSPLRVFLTQLAIAALILLLGANRSYAAVPEQLAPVTSIEIPKEYFPGFLHPAFDAANSGGYEQALKLINRELKLIDSDLRERFSRLASESKIYLLKAITLKAKGEPSQSLALLDKAITLTPGSAEIHLEKAHLLSSLGKKDQAIGSYKDALWFRRSVGVVDSAHLALAKLYLEKKLNLEAKAALQNALLVNPSNMDALKVLSTLEFESGNHTAGVKALRDALLANPSSVEIKLALGRALLDQSDRLTDQTQVKEANVIAEEIRHSTTEPKLQREATLLLIRSDIMLGSIDLAEKQLAELTKMNSKDPEIPRLKKQIEIEKAATPLEDQSAVIEAELQP